MKISPSSFRPLPIASAFVATTAISCLWTAGNRRTRQTKQNGHELADRTSRQSYLLPRLPPKFTSSLSLSLPGKQSYLPPRLP
mmetsp:Transcript_25931/g.58540  ORF Transcript_25931/g.58540 Transcript_25931/m.58540 type:complete len:83 (-) Transcript_25931:63-311(-)|eukprot:761654-Hanusia_phi.AAC.3